MLSIEHRAMLIHLQICGDHKTRHKDHQKRKPCAHEAPNANVLAADEHPTSKPYHIPTGTLVVVHLRQGQSDMGMAVVTENIVHSGTVDDGRLRHALVPGGCTTTVHFGRIQLKISGRTTECKVILGHEIGTGKVPDDAVRHGDTQVTDYREEPGEHWNRCPHDAKGEPASGNVNRGSHYGGR